MVLIMFFILYIYKKLNIYVFNVYKYICKCNIYIYIFFFSSSFLFFALSLHPLYFLLFCHLRAWLTPRVCTPRASQCLEIIEDPPASAPFTCKPHPTHLPHWALTGLLHSRLRFSHPHHARASATQPALCLHLRAC